MTITEPGIYSDVDEATYHTDTGLEPHLGRSLSVSGAKVLLQSPARFAYEREHGHTATRAMDVGSVVHALALRGGENRIRVFDRTDWRGAAAKQKDELQRAGLVPVHRGELLAASKVARAVRRHRLAGAILSDGLPEQSIYWTDEETGVTCRGRIDWLRDNAIVDLKTSVDASPAAFAKSAANLGYHQQAAWYSDGIAALGGGQRPFLFVVVEKEPPHLVAVYQLDDEALAIGRERNRRARELFAECESSGVWPGYSDDIETLSLPRWATY